jgi:hypothetical protein
MTSHSDVFCFTPHHRPMFDFMMAEALANHSSELRVQRSARGEERIASTFVGIRRVGASPMAKA